MRKLTDMYSRVREKIKATLAQAKATAARLGSRRRPLMTALGLAWVIILIIASFSVFRMTYGRPWFSAPASFESSDLREALADAEEKPRIPETEPNGIQDSRAPPEDESLTEGPRPGDLFWPVGDKSSVVSSYGLVNCPTLKRPLYHAGIDVAAPEGTEVRAPYAGVVREVFRDLKMGWQMILDHGGGVTTVYACLDETLVGEGQTIQASQPIAVVGNTGLSEVALGPHLHFEVRIDDRPINPLTWLEP